MKRFLCCLVCAVTSFNAASGIRVYPFVYSFAPESDKHDDTDTDKRDEFTYSITNKLNETVAFEVSVYRRYVDKDGKDHLVKDDNSFSIFPSQLIIGPRMERVVKLRWMGNKDFEKNPNKEQAFRVEIKQFHIDLNPFQKKSRKETSSVEFNIQVMTSLYMTPGASKAVPVITKTKTLPNGIALVTVENRGSRRVEYKKINTEISLPKYTGPLSKVLPESDREGAIQPGCSHEFIISGTGGAVSEKAIAKLTKNKANTEKKVQKIERLKAEELKIDEPLVTSEEDFDKRSDCRGEDEKNEDAAEPVYKVKSFANYKPGQDKEEEEAKKKKKKRNAKKNKKAKKAKADKKVRKSEKPKAEKPKIDSKPVTLEENFEERRVYPEGEEKNEDAAEPVYKVKSFADYKPGQDEEEEKAKAAKKKKNKKAKKAKAGKKVKNEKNSAGAEIEKSPAEADVKSEKSSAEQQVKNRKRRNRRNRRKKRRLMTEKSEERSPAEQA